MFRGVSDYQRPLTVGRVPDSQRAPDSHRGPAFFAGPDGQRGPDCPDVIFCRSPHRVRVFCEGFGCFRRSFGPRGPEHHKGGAHPPPPPPPATSLLQHLRALATVRCHIEGRF